MKDLEIEQGTKRWLEERMSYIGGSDAPIIMGVSPWKTPYQLWEEKMGNVVEDKDKEFIFARGHRMEDKARRIFDLLWFRRKICLTVG